MVYDVKCQKCGTVCEVREPMTVPSERPCTVKECDGTAVRVIGRTSFQLKGAGWAKDRYGL